MNQKQKLLELIDQYAEARHIQGHSTYNIKTAAARQAVIEALSGVALSAAPNGWESVIDEARSGLQDSEPSAFDNSGYRAFAETVLDAVEEGLSALAASPTPPAEQQAAQVIIDFSQVGTAGPFPVVNGRVSLPDATMQDLARMLRPTYEAEQQAAPKAAPGEPGYREKWDAELDERRCAL